jgi:CO dehydrogenase/acetyl-CoA synthase beta subunit
MAAFDECIGQVSDYGAELRHAGRQVRELDPRRELPIRVGPNAAAGIILRGDTFVELGSPQVGSCASLLWTTDDSRVTDGRITLFGPDIPESRGASLPFGQVLLVAGRDLDESAHERLQQAQHVSGEIEGYMVRSTAENIWGRVSHEAAAKGFDCRTLGTALITLVKRAEPAVSAVEVLFVTTDREDVKRLAGICSNAKQVAGNILKETWKARGYDVDCSFDCGSCMDESVCDDIREVIVAARKVKARAK